MAHEYSWQQARSEPTYRADNHDHLGWWAAAAMLVSIILHVIVFFALDQVKFVLGIDGNAAEQVTERVTVTRPVEEIPADFVAPPPPEDAVIPPPLDTAKLLEDVDLLPLLKDQEIEMKPDVNQTTIAIAAGSPVQSGDPRGATIDISAGMDSTKLDLPDFGRQDYEMKPAAIGQITVDPGASKADPTNLDKFTDQIKQGAGGKAEKGTLEGLTSLDDMLGLTPNELLGAKTMLSSDLLFAFNKYDLRESARINLAKLGMIIDKSPDMYCWIEGHTDLIGNDVANLELSIRRAEAVKRYLVDSMGYDPDKIITRGYGRYQPIITTGDKDQQAPNRRVEIKMRKTPPKDEQIAPPKAAVVQEEMPPPPPKPEPAPSPEPAPPKARLVKPNPPMPVEVVDPPAREVPKAKPVEEAPPAPRAKLVPEMPVAPPAKAIPVAEDESNVLRAQPVTE